MAQAGKLFDKKNAGGGNSDAKTKGGFLLSRTRRKDTKRHFIHL